jgi:hypothetical protein
VQDLFLSSSLSSEKLIDNELEIESDGAIIGFCLMLVPFMNPKDAAITLC